jgi:NAD(P)-dependent dehydrogenase (short-subunit alcohol dehydrogenase family)
VDVRGAVVLVTGASSGIGRAAALAFDRAGARVAMAARRRDRLAENASRMRDPLVVPTDLTDEAQTTAMVERTLDHYGRLDVLVNNAAMIPMSRADSLRPPLVRRVLETNLLGPMIATNRAVRAMRRQGGGHVINVSSPGFLLGVPLLGAYAMSKAALSGWTRCLQAEWAGTEIAVTEYLPGYIDTESEAESDFGALGPDVFQDPDQSLIARWFTNKTPAEKVAADLIECVRRPRLLMYSSPSVRLLLWMARFVRLRQTMGAAMARTCRKRLNITVFSD